MDPYQMTILSKILFKLSTQSITCKCVKILCHLCYGNSSRFFSNWTCLQFHEEFSPFTQEVSSAQTNVRAVPECPSGLKMYANKYENKVGVFVTPPTPHTSRYVRKVFVISSQEVPLLPRRSENCVVDKWEMISQVSFTPLSNHLSSLARICTFFFKQVQFLYCNS